MTAYPLRDHARRGYARGMTTKTATVTATFDAMTAREDWLGFGYLGARRNALDTSDPEITPTTPAELAKVDAWLLRVMHAWTADEIFAWANSKYGRWFGDEVFGSRKPLQERLMRAVRHNLIVKVAD